MQVLFKLLADGGEHARRAMADVEAADAAGKIEIAVAVDVLDGSAIGARGEHRRGVRSAARIAASRRAISARDLGPGISV